MKYKLILLSFFYSLFSTVTLANTEVLDQIKEFENLVDRELLNHAQIRNTCSTGDLAFKDAEKKLSQLRAAYYQLPDSIFDKNEYQKRLKKKAVEIEKVRHQLELCISFHEKDDRLDFIDRNFDDEKVNCNSSNAGDLNEVVQNHEAEIDNLNIQIGVLEGQIHQGLEPILPKSKFTNLRNKLRKDRDKFKLCLFKRHIKMELKRVGSEDKQVKSFLSKLSHVSTCLNKENKNLNLFSNLFGDIYKHFSNKKELKDEDCEVLTRTYEMWYSF